MADFRETADLLLRSFLEKITLALQVAKIEIVTDQRLHQDSNNSFSCSVVLKRGAKELPAEKIHVSFAHYPMVKFFGRTWTEFEGERGIAPFLTVIQDSFAK
jgi:hypothetical protein